MSKQPHISPIDSLVDLACRDGVDVRPTLLRVITDLYVQKPAHSDDETTQYVELALGLIDAVDEQTRAVVATTLLQYPAAPKAVVTKLTAAAGAPRASLALPPIAFGEDIRPQRPAAPEPPAASANDDLIEVFFAADRDDRRLILLNLDVVANGAPLLTVPPDVIRQLEAAALKRHQADFARLLASTLRIRRELADRIAQDPSGEPIVVAAKAIGVPAAVLQRILLCLNPAIGTSVERVFDLAVLFDEISASAASHMVSIWRDLAPAIIARPRHEPLYQDDVRTVRRPAARESRRADVREAGATQKTAR